MSLTGLNEGDFTSINVLRSIGLGNRAGRGANNQVIKSDGNNANWSDIASSDIIQGSSTIQVDTSTDPDTLNCLKVPQPLRAGSNVAFADSEGNIVNTFDGSVDTTIATQNDVYTGGDGIAVSGSNVISADTDGTTTTNAGGSGSQIAVLKVPNSLTAGTNISFSTGSTYDGSTAITISSTDTNTEYTAGTGLSLSVGNEFSINLTEGTGITISGAEISLTSDTISGVSLGNDLGQLRLTVRGATSTYDGSSNVAVNLDSNYTALRIPTSSSGLPSGALFNNSGTPAFVP